MKASINVINITQKKGNLNKPRNIPFFPRKEFARKMPRVKWMNVYVIVNVIVI